jgi:hypothetical protein
MSKPDSSCTQGPIALFDNSYHLCRSAPGLIRCVCVSPYTRIKERQEKRSDFHVLKALSHASFWSPLRQMFSIVLYKSVRGHYMDGISIQNENTGRDEIQ